MIQPLLKDEAFLADVRAANQDGSDFRLWWLGQSGFLVQFQRKHLLLVQLVAAVQRNKVLGADQCGLVGQHD